MGPSRTPHAGLRIEGSEGVQSEDSVGRLYEGIPHLRRALNYTELVSIMSCSENFRIAIIGSGPVGKLLLASVTQHPRIEYAQFESETLPLRPSYGYGIGPQVFKTLTKLNPALAAEFRKQCLISPVWMNFRHAGDESIDLPTVKAPQGEYGRLGREELMDLLDSFCPADVPIYYGKKLVAVTKTGGELKLAFEDGTEHRADAVWACDGMGSLCRQLIQGPDYERMAYSGSIAFRGKIPSHLVTEAIGEEYTQTQMFIGLKGFHVLTFPIAGGKLINIVAFSIEEVLKKRGRNYKTTTEELLGYFPGASKTLQTLLRVGSSRTPSTYRTHSLPVAE